MKNNNNFGDSTPGGNYSRGSHGEQNGRRHTHVDRGAEHKHSYDSQHNYAYESNMMLRRHHRAQHSYPPKKSRRWLTWVLVFGILGGIGTGAFFALRPQIDTVLGLIFWGSKDYEGTGFGEVLFTVHHGDSGSDVANNLQEAGVVKTSEAFYRLLLKQEPEVEFYPGIFRLAKQMSAQAALDTIQNPDSHATNRVVFPEGYNQKQVFDRISETTGIQVSDLNKEAENPVSFGLPPQALNLEGFLFPTTYNFPETVTAHEVIDIMVKRAFEEFDKLGIPQDQVWEKVILASIIEREARIEEDFKKISRVFWNRLEQGKKLESDATVTYGTGNIHRVETLDSERADATNLYNTYVHEGLPVGPISNPGIVALRASLEPADGPWMYFVTWNLKTGETIFSVTLAEHEAAVKKWRTWMKENPEYE